MLAVIQHQQQLLVTSTAASESDTATPGSSRTPPRGHRRRHPRRVRDSGQLHRHAPSARPLASSPATSPASRLTHPPGPVTVTSRNSPSNPATSSTAPGPANETRQRRHQAMHGPRHRILCHSHAGQRWAAGNPGVKPGRRTGDLRSRLRTPGRTRAARPRRARHCGHRRPAARRLGSGSRTTVALRTEWRAGCPAESSTEKRWPGCGTHGARMLVELQSTQSEQSSFRPAWRPPRYLAPAQENPAQEYRQLTGGHHLNLSPPPGSVSPTALAHFRW